MENKNNKMISNLDEDVLKEETLANVKSIISMNAKEEMEYEKILRIQMKMLFYDDDNNSNQIKFPDIESSHAQLLAKLIELIVYILSNYKNLKERRKIYDTDINDISAQKNKLSKIISELNKLENISFEINDNLVALFNVISEELDKKEVFSLYEYIDSIILTLSFISKNESILKFQIYSYIIKFYLTKFNILLGFSKEEINVSDKLSIDLIHYLFTRQELSDELLTLSVIILNYNSLKDSVSNKPFEQIIECAKICAKKIKKYYNTAILIEKILAIFLEELEKVERIKKRNIKKREKNKKLEVYTKAQNSQKKSDYQKVDEDGKKNETNLRLNIKDDKESQSELGHKKDSTNLNCDKSLNDFLNSNKKINICFDNLINKIKMGNKDLTNDIDEIKNYMITLVQQNNTLTQKYNEIKDENEALKTKIAKIDALSEENKFIKNRLNDIENNYEEIKFTLGEIQFRKLSKNFLHYVKSYLIDNNYNVKKIDKESRGEKFSEYIGYLFPKANKKKLAIVQSLIEKSADLANDGDESAHSLEMDYYYDEIEDYKNKKGLDTLRSYEIFCYLINLNVPDKDFDDSFSFLRKYFTRNLKAKDNNIDIFSIYLN